MGVEQLLESPPEFEKFQENSVQEIFQKSVHYDATNFLLQPGTVTELTENLILTSASCVTRNLLDFLNITCVIHAAPELPDIPLHRADILYHRIPVLDSGSWRISPFFDEAADLIHEISNLGGKTLIYCVAGVSRSASICLAYLMKYQRMTLLDAFKFVKLRRAKIKPNCGFFKQLIEYEKSLYGDNTIFMVFNQMVQMEIPDVYDAEYQFFTKKKQEEQIRRC